DEPVRSDPPREAQREPSARGAELGHHSTFGNADRVHDLLRLLPLVAIRRLEQPEILRLEQTPLGLRLGRAPSALLGGRSGPRGGAVGKVGQIGTGGQRRHSDREIRPRENSSRPCAFHPFHPGVRPAPTYPDVPDVPNLPTFRPTRPTRPTWPTRAT